jgi:hypothetical protein
MSKQTPPLLPESDRALTQQFLDLFNGIDKENPDPADRQALREMLHNHPELWRHGGDLAHIAALCIIQQLEPLPNIAEPLKRGWHALKDELGYSAASTPERLVIEQVLLGYLHYHTVDFQYTAATAKAIDPSSANYWERRLSSAQRRYVGAIESLARISKYARTTPALQVNIAADGGQQLNLLGGDPPDDDEH